MICTKITREDAFQIMALAEMMHKESGYNKQPYDPKRVWDLLSSTLTHPHKYVIVYNKEDNGEITGGIMGAISEQFFSGELVASDYGIFIHPDKRGGSLILRLIKAFETWAIENNAVQMVVGHTTGVKMDKAISLYEHLGFNLKGYLFNKDLT